MTIEIVTNGMVRCVVDDEPSGSTKGWQCGSTANYLRREPVTEYVTEQFDHSSTAYQIRRESSLTQVGIEFEQFSRQPIQRLGNEGLWRLGEVEIDAQQTADPDEGDDEDGAGNEALGQDDGVRLEIGAIRVFVGFPRLASSFLDNGSGGALRQF